MSPVASSRTLFDDPRDLVRSLKQRNYAALEFVHDKYSASLYAIIIGILNNPFSSGVALENVMKTIWKQVEQYEDNKSSLFTWMIGLARAEAFRVKAASAEQP